MGEIFKEGDICRGVVFHVADFGVFIKIGDSTGFANVTEITWARFTRVSEVVKNGQEVIALIIGFDADRDQVLLSIKALREDPLKRLACEEFGKAVTGNVTRLTPIGIFVSLKYELNGLLHNSELLDAGKEFQVGDEICVQVIHISLDSRQILLALIG